MWWKIKLEHHRSCKIEKEEKPKLGQKRKKSEPDKGSQKQKKQIKNNNTVYYDTTI